MKNFVPKSSSALITTTLTAILALSQVVKADDSVYEYNPAAELTTKFSKGRNIGELNYMQPLLSNGNHLPILDLKLKLDNRKSKEINLGLVYRYNYDDKAILGTYAYFDHRRTESNFSISGLTAGVEALSKYIDARVNIYIPQNKRKKIAHNNQKIVKITGTSIFTSSGGHKYESALKGYDIEVGTPLFAFSDSLNEKFRTKVYAARYSFTAKNVKPIVGTRFRIQQDLGKIWSGDNSYKFHISAETQFDKVRKRQNFIGLGVKVAFNDKKNSYTKKPSVLRHRMMESVMRDVDIVTESAIEAPTEHNFYMGGKEIKNIYYVGSARTGYSGDGTKAKPMSLDQMNSTNCDNAIIIVTSIDSKKGGTNISPRHYAELKEMPQVLNGKENVELSTVMGDKLPITINDDFGISISAIDVQNTKIIVENNQISPISSKNGAKFSTIQLLEPKVLKNLETQLAIVQQQSAQPRQQQVAQPAQPAHPRQQQVAQPAQPEQPRQPAALLAEIQAHSRQQQVAQPAQPAQPAHPRQQQVAQPAQPEQPRQPDDLSVESELSGARTAASVDVGVRNQAAAIVEELAIETLLQQFPQAIETENSGLQRTQLRQNLIRSVQQQLRGGQDLGDDEVINEATAIVEQVINRVLGVNFPQAPETGNLEPQSNSSDIPEVITTTSQELIDTMQGAQIGDVEVLRQDGEIVEEELEFKPQGTYNSGVDRNSLSPNEQELYDLITQGTIALKLETANVDNKYVIRQTRYNTVSNIIKNNPNSGIVQIEQLIENDTTIRDKGAHKNLAAAIMRFNGNVSNASLNGGQQGIGITATGPKDITMVASLEKLRETYGILDGDKALELAKKIAISVIKTNIPRIDNDYVAAIARTHSNTPATNDYKQAVKTYLDSQRSPTAESNQQKILRQQRKNNARNIINREIRSSLTAVNNNLAAYRALDRATELRNQELFTEAILGRYNDREMLAYAIMANLDVREIQENLQQGGIRLTASSIWARQQENIQGLIKQLGNAQRAYNMDHETGVVDVGGIEGLYTNSTMHRYQSRPLRDAKSCPHGHCIRIVDSMQHHRQVNLSDASPSSLAYEFHNGVKKKVNLLSTQQKNQIESWKNTFSGAEVNITFNNERNVIFSTEVYNDQVELPSHYRTILTDVAAETDSRYNFTNPNHKLQLVKKQSAVDVFKYAQYIEFND